MTALYFSSRKDFANKATWSKEQLPPDYTVEEVKMAAQAAGKEGFAIVQQLGTPNYKLLVFKWLV